MSRQTYDWPRYWYRRDEEVPIIDGGFLRRIDPEHGILYGFSGTESYDITDLTDVPCLILLGEPGMGKSYALENVRGRLSNTLTDKYGFFSFSDYDKVADLINEVFSENDDFTEWVSSDFRLHLFLDGLDEAPLQSKSVARRLCNTLSKHQTDLHRLRLRITCRLADWPISFEEQLKRLWTDTEVQVFVLAPLQQRNVIDAAKQNQIDADTFLEEIVQREVTPLAARPITLLFLLDEYRRNGSLPSTRAELYRKGCETLCTEFSDPHAQQDRFEPEERFWVASRIAAYSIFSRRVAIHMQPLVDNESEALTIEECCGGAETINDLTVYVHRGLVEETLDTALFRGGEARQWAHQTYAEFLAALYASHTLETTQIRNLLFHSSNRLIPQLTETAAWVTAFKPEILESLLKSDPEVLLKSDVATGDLESKKELTQALLKWRERDPHSHYDWKRLSVLNHEGLGQLLKPYIEDQTIHSAVRMFAMEIAVACQVLDLLGPMAEIALDEDEQYRLRVEAARGVANFGDPVSKAKLKPLALLPYTAELTDLKRYGIQATWPTSLTAAELFPTLTFPTQDEDYLFSILNDGLDLIPEGLQSDDLPVALEWVQQQDRIHKLPYSFTELFDQVLLLAWMNLDQPDVGEAFANTIITLWSKHAEVLDRHRHRSASIFHTEKLTEETVRKDTNKRILLLRHLLRLAKDYKSDIAFYFEVDVPLLTFDDVPSLIEIFEDSVSTKERALIAELIRRVVNTYEAKQFEYIYEAGRQNVDLWEALDYQLFLELESQAAKEAKEWYEKRKRWEQEREQLDKQRAESALDPPPAERVKAYLEAFNEGDTDAWWQMSHWMIFNPDGSFTNNLMWEPDMVQLPVWKGLDEDTRKGIIASSTRYLEVCDPETYQWRAELDKTYKPIIAGYRALYLLLTHETKRLTSLQLETWQKWVPPATYYVYKSRRYSMPMDDGRTVETLWRLLYLVSPELFIETLFWIIDKENETDGIYVVESLDPLWDDYLEQELSQKLLDENLTWKSQKTILEKLAVRNFALVKPFLKKYLPSEIPMGEEARERAYLAGSLFLFNAEDAGWPIMWPLMLQDTKFGVELIRRIAGDDRRAGRIPSKLDERELADTYMWMYGQFNPADDPKPKGFYTITTEMEVASLRDSLLRNLISRGTEESIQQLRRIGSTIDIDLEPELTQAEIQLRRNSWKPITVKELKMLAQDRRLRWIQSGDQLLNHIIELLEKLNHELQGHTGTPSSAIDLWNENNERDSDGKWQTRYRPKDENRLSDYVARYLKRELEGHNVFVSRETQIQRGKFTDIYVETYFRLPNDEFGDPITLVIEVKGCWHENLKTAMKEQLVDQYLAARGLKHGIYLVGRFLCDSWDKDDSRWQKSPKVDDSVLQDFLDDQAMKQARSDYIIRPFLLNARL